MKNIVSHKQSYYVVTLVVALATFCIGFSNASAFSIATYTYAEHSYLGGGGNGVSPLGGGQNPPGTSYTWSWTGVVQADGTIGEIRIGNWVAGGDSFSGSGGNSGNNGGGGGYSQFSYYSQSAYEVAPPDIPTVTTFDPSGPTVTLYIKKTGTPDWLRNVQVLPSDEVSLRWVTARATNCQSTDLAEFSVTDTSGVSGSTDTVVEPNSGTSVYGIRCKNAAGLISSSTAGLTILLAPFEFTAQPKIVRTNETTELTWNVHGRTGCTIAKKVSGDDASTVTTDSGTRDTVKLSGETTYTLKCSDGAKADVIIKVLPSVSET